MSTLRFSSTLKDNDLASYPEMAKIAAKGDRLTKLDLSFWGSELKSDITLEEDANQADFRQTITEYNYISCDSDAGVVVILDGGQPLVSEAGTVVLRKANNDGGCAIGGSGTPSPLILLGLLLTCFGFAFRPKARKE